MQFPYKRGFKNDILPITYQPLTLKKSKHNQNTCLKNSSIISIFATSESEITVHLCVKSLHEGPEGSRVQ